MSWVIAMSVCVTFGLFTSQSISWAQDRARDITPVEDFTRNRPKGNRKRPVQRPKVYRLASGRPSLSNTLASANGQIGVTVWHLRPAAKIESGARILLWGADREEYVAHRVSTETPIPRGAKIRLSIESARSGYLYVINRTLHSDGSAGAATLIFPARKMRDNDNKVRPGRLVDIPGQKDRPNYLEATPKMKDQVAELLILLVTERPLEFALGDTETPVPLAELNSWERKWGSGAQKFEMVGGVGHQWTDVEKEAAGSGRRLREDEPPPQTVFRLPEGKDDGLLVTVTLKYSRPRPRRRR